jgi:hypothetical protein
MRQGDLVSKKSIGEMTSEEIHEAVSEGLGEVARRLESGEIDGSGRYYTDEELASWRATGQFPDVTKRRRAR